MYTTPIITPVITPADVSNEWYVTAKPLQPPIPDWIIEGLLAKGELLLLTGSTADARSFFSRHMLVAAANGDDWLSLQTGENEARFLGLRHYSDEVRQHLGLSDADRNLSDAARDLSDVAKDSEVIVIDDLDAFAEDDKHEAALALGRFAARNNVAIVALTDKPLDDFNYLHIFRNAFQKRWGMEVMESYRYGVACRFNFSQDTSGEEPPF